MSIMVIVVITLIGFYAVTAAIVFSFTSTRRRREELQAEVQTRLIDRFGTAPELIDFLQSEAGHRFVNGFHNAPKFAARERILRGIRSGIVISLLGLGFLAIFVSDIDGNWGFMYPGFILLALGLGFFFSSWMSLRLSRSWGIIEDKNEPRTPNP